MSQCESLSRSDSLCESCHSQCDVLGCDHVEPNRTALQTLDTALQINKLQVQVVQQQEALCQCEQDIRAKEVVVNDIHTRYRYVAFVLRQAQLSRAEVEGQLQSERAQRAELLQAFDFHEVNRVESERRLFECWQTVKSLADVVKVLRDYLDGPRLSDEERAIDVQAIIMERETLRIEVGGLKNLLVEANTKGATVKDQLATLHGEIAHCHAQFRVKDKMIAELESSLARCQRTEGPPITTTGKLAEISV